MQTSPFTLSPIHPAWREFLEAQGAILSDRQVEHFGKPEAERIAVANRDVIADLSHLALLRVEGPDSESFLQGQLSNDIRLVTDNRAQLSAYCNPKGRMLAIFLVARHAGAYYLQLPAVLAESVTKRLRMFILRANTRIDLAEADTVAIGLSGPNAERLMNKSFGAVPATPFEAVTEDGVTAVRLPGPSVRFELIAKVERIKGLWGQFKTEEAVPVGAPAWSWLDIRAGVPTVLLGTVEEFVPQMANLELVGGVSFNKGCYPGQEIVARMHYLGRLKQRMVLAHVDTSAPPASGTLLYAPDLPGQSTGSVVAAELSPAGGCDLLAVAQLSSIKAGEIHLSDINGPVLKISPLPYRVPTD